MKRRQLVTPDGKALFASLAGPPVNARVKTMLRDLFGTGRGGRPDTAAAAAGLGRSRRQIQRWLKDGLPKSSPAARELEQRWQASPKARQRRLSPAARTQFVKNRSVSGSFYGDVQVSSERRSTPRWVNFDIDGAEAAAMYDAMIQGDDEAYEAFINGISDEYGGSVTVNLIEVRWTGI